jgi:hypothetical protein
MPAPSVLELQEAFKTYFDEMDRCAQNECYWALLHLVVVMPDVCAALEHDKGDTTGESGLRYEDWCSRYWTSPTITADRRWKIRCALLHQGRTVLKTGETFSYIRPAEPGSRIHEYVDPVEPNTTLEVDQLAVEIRTAMARWFADLQKPTNARQANNVAKYLYLVAREKPKTFPPGAPIVGPTARRLGTSST